MSDPTRVMVDIESLGTDPGAAILSIGAVAFDDAAVDEDAGFYREISLQSNEAAGLSFDADTIEWWFAQPDEAASVLTGGDDLGDVVVDFIGWYADVDPDEIWANSPSFDCLILAAAFDAVGAECPWAFYEERDFRTLKNLPGVDEPFAKTADDGVKHDAFDDAIAQARTASNILSSIDG